MKEVIESLYDFSIISKRLSAKSLLQSTKKDSSHWMRNQAYTTNGQNTANQEL